jgi:hypothetical protein
MVLSITPQTESPSSILEKLRLRLVWVIYFLLGLCIALSAFSLGNQIITGQTWATAVWAIAVFIILAILGYNLELNMVKGYYKLFLSIGLLVAICIMAVGVVSVILGLIGNITMVAISSLLLILCVFFASDFFNKSRLYLVLRVLIFGVILSVVLFLMGFLF